MLNNYKEHWFAFLFAISRNRIKEFSTKATKFFSKDFRYDSDYSNLTSSIQGLNFQSKSHVGEINTNLDSRKTEMPILKVCLAGKSFTINNDLTWREYFDDEENSFSLHRFGWMLEAIAGKRLSERESLNLIIHWITFNSGNGGVGWDSYSISERVTNWCIAFRTLIVILPSHDPIILSIRKQLDYLVCNLEIRGTATNNHLLNNGRSLLIAGLVLQEKRYLEIGDQIISIVSKKILTKSGMSQEGSSHYQILIARIYLEILWFSFNYAKLSIFKKYFDVAKKTFEAASLFFRSTPFPYIGDISPDFDREFFEDILLVGNSILNGHISNSFDDHSKSWSYFFGTITEAEHDTSQINELLPFLSSPNKKTPRPRSGVNSVNKYQDAGFYYFNYGDLSLYIYLNPNNAVSPGSHAHSDVGSFILNYKNKNILFDSGRANYLTTLISQHGRSIKAHNGIRLDNREPQIVHGLNGLPELMDPEFLGGIPQIEIEESPLCVKLIHPGYQRISKEIIVTRLLKLRKDQILIEDNITGHGNHFIETFFHLTSNQIRKTKSSLSITIDDIQVGMECDCPEAEIKIIRGMNNHENSYFSVKSEHYGKMSEFNTIILRQDAQLPLINQYEINLE